METKPIIPHKGFVKTHNKIVPVIPNTPQKINAWLTDKLPVGIGLALVLYISLSKSFSIIWLNPLAAAVTKNPPKHIAKTCFQLNVSATVKKVIIAEKTTKAESVNLVSFKNALNLL